MFGLFDRPAPKADAARYPVQKTDAQWRAQLPGGAYDVLRHEGTEAPYTSPLNKVHQPGVFSCMGCNNALYKTADKFDSGTGWPSFTRPIASKGAILTKTDRSMFMARTEVHCARCGGHLGHVFNDGPAPTGLRYCMNGVAMIFRAG